MELSYSQLTSRGVHRRLALVNRSPQLSICSSIIIRASERRTSSFIQVASSSGGGSKRDDADDESSEDEISSEQQIAAAREMERRKASSLSSSSPNRFSRSLSWQRFITRVQSVGVICGLLASWYASNIMYNLFNKQVLQAFPLATTCTLIHLVVASVLMSALWLLRIKKVSQSLTHLNYG